MNTLHLKVPGLPKKSYTIPGNWNELSKRQLLKVCKIMLDLPSRKQQLQILLALLPEGFFARLRFALAPADQVQHWMVHLTRFIYEESPQLTNDILDSFRYKRETYIGPKERFKNLTFEEFMVCEDILSRFRLHGEEEDLLQLVAVLYRPVREIVERHHRDIRQPFLHHHLESDTERLCGIKPELLKAVALCYTSFRLHLKDAFPQVFPKKKVKELDTKGQSWVPLVRAMAPSVTEWEKVERLSVWVVLYDFNKRLEEEKERKAREK